MLIPLGENTAHLWRQVVSNTFSSPHVIMEPRTIGGTSVSNSVIERRNSIATSKLVTGEVRVTRREAYRMPEGIAEGAINFDPEKKEKAEGTNVKNAIGRGVSYVIYWKCSEDFGQELFKVSLTIYQKDILQVCGFSFKEPTCEP